jgi:hypothetical protein
MRYKDPSYQLLKAAAELLSDSIIYGGQVIYAGTRIPRNKTKYIYIYIESILNKNTGDGVIYDVILSFQIVDVQLQSEGDETAVNSIFEQVLALVDDKESYIMTDFKSAMCEFSGSEYLTEMGDSNYTITRKLRISHFIEQNI